jgi:hypothetical protein
MWTAFPDLIVPNRAAAFAAFAQGAGFGRAALGGYCRRSIAVGSALTSG